MPVSRDVGRIEGFSDAVFGFALTLLVVSLEVPRTFDEMMLGVRALPAFAASFAILLMIWQEHHQFFKRYGIYDGPTIWLNGLLLFLVLFYVYPLKFLMTMLLGPTGVLFGGEGSGVDPRQVPALMTLYGVGFMSVFLILASLHWRALVCFRRAPEAGVDLDRLRLHFGACFVYVAVGLLSLSLAQLGTGPWTGGASGLSYALIGPAFYVYYGLLAPRVFGRRRAAVEDPEAPPSATG